MSEKMVREIRKLLDKKNKYLSKATENLDTISDQTKDTTELFEALRISKKKDSGENISKQDSEKLSDVKKHYDSFLEDEDGNVDESNITAGLTDAISSIKEDKLSLINQVSELRRKAKNIDKEIKEKEKKSSLPDDSTEKDTKDKQSSLPDDSSENEPKHKKRKTFFEDDSAEKEIMEKEKKSSFPDNSAQKESEKKSSLIDDYADTSMEMPEIIDD